MMIRSLRMRLFLGVTAVCVVISVILSIAIDQTVHHTLQADFDRALLEKARSLASMVEQSGDKTHFDFPAEQFPEFAPGQHALYFEILLNGLPYQHSASLDNQHLLLSAAEKSNPQVESLTLPDGRRGRLLTMQFRPLIEADEPPVAPDKLPQCVIAVAQDSSDLANTLGHLHWLLIALCGGAMFLSALALFVVTTRAIRPVKELARHIEAIRETDLSAALAAEDFPGELTPVIERLNGLLARLALAFTRERAFTADVAHEMRTPLAGIRATLQVARSRPREAAAYQSAIDKSLAILDQMQNLVEKLLLLSRADSGQLACTPSPTDLSLLLQECMAAHHESASLRGLHYALTEDVVPDLLMDRELLRIALANLIDNAVSYAQPNTAIVLSLTSQKSMALLEITNIGHCLTEADLPNLLKRFVRKDSSRSATGIHAGLGLSICQRLLALQSATLTLLLDADKFIARVQLPLPG